MKRVLSAACVLVAAASACDEHVPASSVPTASAQPSARGARAKDSTRCTIQAPQTCQTECDAERTDACVILGRLLMSGHERPRDVPRAKRLLDSACRKGSAAGCGALGSLYGSGLDGAKDIRKAIELFDDACERGDALSCQSLGGIHSGADPDARKITPRDPARAAKYYERGCSLDAIGACMMLAGMLADGVGVAKDPKRALALLERGCEAGEGVACKLAGDHHERGDGVTPSRARAAALHDKACRLGYQRACVTGR